MFFMSIFVALQRSGYIWQIVALSRLRYTHTTTNTNNDTNKYVYSPISSALQQYPMHFSGPPRNIATHAQHRFAQAVVIQLTQIGFMYSMHYNYPLTIIK